MVDPSSLVPAFGAVIVGRGGTVVNRASCADGAHIGLGAGRADLTARGVLGREFFRMLTLEKKRLLVAHPHVAENAGRMVPEGRIGIAGRTSAVEVHAAIEFEENVFSRAVGPRNNGEITLFHHRDGGLVRVGCGGDVGGVTAIGQAVRVEVDVTVWAVFPGDGDPRHFLSVLVKRDGRTWPERRKLRRAPAENIVASGRNDDAAEFPRVFVKTAHEGTVRAFGVLVEVSIRRKVAADGAGLALREVVIEHRDHGYFLRGRAAAGVAELVAIVAALVGHIIAV